MRSTIGFLFFTLLVMVACQKDKKCALEGDLSVLIVGRWDVEVFGFLAGEAEFLADGTLIDADGVFINVEIGGVVLDQKSYVVISDSLIIVRAENGDLSQETEIEVTSYSCEEIKTNVFGFAVTLDRK
jgi:hypothetical protein